MEIALLTGRMHTTQMSFVCFFAESRSGRNAFAVKGQELTSPCTFRLHESKYQTTTLRLEVTSPREVVGPGTRYHRTPFVRKLADNLIRRRIDDLLSTWYSWPGNALGGPSLVAASRWRMVIREGAGGGSVSVDMWVPQKAG